MTEETWENIKGTWEDEMKEAFTKNTGRPLQDLIDASTDLSKPMDIGIAFAIVIGELQRHEKKIRMLEEEIHRC